MTSAEELACQLITKHEGCRYTVYDDANGRAVVPGYTMIGHPTIGIGRALDVKGLSQAETNSLFASDIVDARRIVQDFLGPETFALLDPVRTAVLIDMAHNLGRGLLKFKGTRAAIVAGDYDRAAAQMLGSLWAKQVKGRAVRLAEMMKTGKAGDV